MVYVVAESYQDVFADELEEMYQLRRKVFFEKLGWDLKVDPAGRERDEFDSSDAEYLLDLDREGRVLGSLRLLPTTQPHLLTQHFPHLCDGQIPQGPSVREISRFATAPGLPRDKTMRVRHRLATALMEYGLLLSLQSYTLVTHVSWLPTLLCVGWKCDPLGLPQGEGTQALGALQIEVSTEGLAGLRAFGGRFPVLHLQTHPPTLTPSETRLHAH